MAYLGKSPTEVFRAFSVKDTFTGDGSTTVFTLSRAAFVGSPNDVQVFVDNVRQEPGSGKAYTIALDGSSNATQLTFTVAPPSASEIYVIISAEPTSVVVPADGSVSTSKIADGSITSAKIADGTVIAADVGDNVITGAKLKSDIAISTSGNITTTGAFTSTGIDDNATSTAITISSSENVGIGTTSPQYDLHIADGSPILALEDTDTNTIFNLNASSTSGIIQYQADVTSVGGNPEHWFKSQNRLLAKIHDNADFSFYEDTGTTPKMFWDASTERLGIGTSSSIGKLHIQSSDVNHIYLNGTSGDAYGLWVNDTGTNFNLGSWSGRETVRIDGDGNTIQFETENSERMRITSAGNVGIGTSNPGYPLDVAGVIRISTASDYCLRVGSTDGYAGILLYDGNTTAQTNNQIVALGNELRFKTLDTYRITINSSGNVGIGTTSPDYKLQVDGDIVPEADNTYDLGKSSLVWANIYTGDLHLSNEAKDTGNSVDGTKGNWTIQEGENDLYIINNRNGKKYKFNLEEIN